MSKVINLEEECIGEDNKPQYALRLGDRVYCLASQFISFDKKYVKKVTKKIKKTKHCSFFGDEIYQVGDLFCYFNCTNKNV